jgi:(R,R)-butanediol dehydrogenase/meso-butanediol dehydrogenase/diacetyl reductase
LRAAVYKGDQRIEVEDVPELEVGPGQILVRVKYCSVCGTDVHGFMYDVVPAGHIMGHEFSGAVSVVGSDVSRWRVGDRVVGGGGSPPAGSPGVFSANPRFNFRKDGWSSQPPWASAYAEFVLMEEWEPTPIPDGVSELQAALAEPLATAVHAVRGSGLRVGDSVAVLGAGPIGLFTMQVAKVGGASKVIAVEPAPARASAALEIGASDVIDPVNADVEESLAEVTGGLGPDLVFDCAGVKSSLQTALTSARHGGRVVVVALAWEDSPVLPVDWISRDLTMTTSLAWAPEDWRIGLDLISDGRVLTEPLLPPGSIIGLDGVQAAFEALTSPNEQIKIVVEP